MVRVCQGREDSLFHGNLPSCRRAAGRRREKNRAADAQACLIKNPAGAGFFNSVWNSDYAPGTMNFATTATSRIATMFAILISGFTAGPAVSLYGSPTVSPVTAAL